MGLGVKEYTIESDSFRTNCIQFGSGKKTLILISGLSVRDVKGKAVAYGIAYSQRQFGEDYTVYLFDRREDLPEQFSVEAIAEDTFQCMRKLGLSEADVIGVSQGSMAAQYLALNHPEAVHKLVLAVPASRANETLKHNIDSWCAYAKTGNMQAVLKDYMYNNYSEPYLKKNAAMIPLLLKIVKTMEPSRFRILAESCLTVNTCDNLEKIQCPMFVIGGEQDKIVTAQAAWEIAEKTGCEIFMYKEYGHSACEETKDFNSRILEFLRA